MSDQKAEDGLRQLRDKIDAAESLCAVLDAVMLARFGDEAPLRLEVAEAHAELDRLDEDENYAFTGSSLTPLPERIRILSEQLQDDADETWKERVAHVRLMLQGQGHDGGDAAAWLSRAADAVEHGLKQRPTICPVCLCSYSSRPAGERCWDRSHQQARGCYGRLMPLGDFMRSEWFTFDGDAAGYGEWERDVLAACTRRRHL